MEMVGHTSIVYSVDSHTSGLIVSGSEDCFAKIWKGFPHLLGFICASVSNSSFVGYFILPC